MPCRHRFAVQGHGPVPRLQVSGKSLVTGAAQERQRRPARGSRGGQRLQPDRVVPRHDEPLFRTDLDAVLAGALQHQGLGPPDMVVGVHRDRGSRPGGLHHKVDVALLDENGERLLLHRDAVGVRLPRHDRPLAGRTERKDVRILCPAPAGRNGKAEDQKSDRKTAGESLGNPVRRHAGLTLASSCPAEAAAPLRRPSAAGRSSLWPCSLPAPRAPPRYSLRSHNGDGRLSDTSQPGRSAG